MLSVLAGFETGLADLRRHLKSIDLTWSLLRLDTAAVGSATAVLGELRAEVGTGASRRQLEYNSVVVTLYGLVEQFVEGMIRTYAARLNRTVPSYTELPETIRANHIELTYALLTRVDQRRFQGIVTTEGLIAKLHSCLSGASQYELNREAFAFHTANFRASVVESTLARIGISNYCARLRLYPAFSSYLQQQFPDRAVESLSQNETYFYLDDLADRRNDVAHGTSSELLSTDLLREYIDFLAAFGRATYDLMRSAAVEFDIKHNMCTALGEPIVVHNHSIVCFSIRDITVRASDVLIAQTSDSARPYVCGTIEELQVNKQTVTEVRAQQSVDVAIRVNYRAKKSYRYFLLDGAVG